MLEAERRVLLVGYLHADHGIDRQHTLQEHDMQLVFTDPRVLPWGGAFYCTSYSVWISTTQTILPFDGSLLASGVTFLVGAILLVTSMPILFTMANLIGAAQILMRLICYNIELIARSQVESAGCQSLEAITAWMLMDAEHNLILLFFGGLKLIG